MDGERRSDIARRFAPRLMRRLNTVLHLNDGTRIDCAVNDISATGAGLSSLTAVLPGTDVAIDLPGIGTIAGRVAWVSGVRIGIAFAESIDPAAIIVPPKPARPTGRRAEDAR